MTPSCSLNASTSLKNNLSTQAFALGLFGYPIQQSKSPILHQIIAKHLNFKLTAYHLLSCDLIQADHRYQEAIDLGLKGASVTIPLKDWAYEKVKSFKITHLSKLASDLQTVNALRWDDDGVFGHNTDVMGFEKSLSRNLKSIKTAVILGAGGASRAVCYALLHMGVYQITWLCRNPEQRLRSMSFFEEMQMKLSIDPKQTKLTVQPFSFEFIPSAIDLCVFTTPPLETYQNFPFHRILNQNHDQPTIIYDLNYGDRASSLKHALFSQKNLDTTQSPPDFTYQDGLSMLCHQGICAFEWFHQIDIEAHLKQMIKLEFEEKVSLNSSKTMNF